MKRLLLPYVSDTVNAADTFHHNPTLYTYTMHVCCLAVSHGNNFSVVVTDLFGSVVCTGDKNLETKMHCYGIYDVIWWDMALNS